MNAKILVFVTYVDAIIYFLLYNLHDCTFFFLCRHSGRPSASFGNSWGNSYTKFFILDIKFLFTCGEWKLFYDIVNFWNIVIRIVLIA